MGKRHGIWLVAAILLAITAGILATKGLPPPVPNPPGAFSFAALGDAPYHAWEALQYLRVLREVNAHDLAFVLHVGDLFERPCTDALYERSLARFRRLRHPLVYTPGDNEWADCWSRRSGRYSPRERLDQIRRIFFDDPVRSLGGTPLPLATQGGREPFHEFVENARWAHAGFLFATVHVVGSRNAMERFPGRTPADDEEARWRTEAAAAWVRETFAEARAAGSAGVVIAFHGDPAFEALPDDPHRRGFERFLIALEEEVERFPGPVLAVHGDGHEYTVDHPLVQRTTGARFANLTRLEVPGSPDVGWVRVVVTPGAEAPFAFEAHVVPRWKYW